MSVINCSVRFAHVKDLASGRAGIPITVEEARAYLAKKCDGKVEDRCNIVGTFKQLATEWRGMVYTNGTIVYENDRVRSLREKREAEAAEAKRQEEIAQTEKLVAATAQAAAEAVARLQALKNG